MSHVRFLCHDLRVTFANYAIYFLHIYVSNREKRKENVIILRFSVKYYLKDFIIVANGCQRSIVGQKKRRKKKEFPYKFQYKL